ncbi:MAG: hypothetical protein ACT4P9_01045 [Betaproteobacteria bacterium]
MITLPRPGAAEEALFERLNEALDAERSALLLGNEEELSRAEREKASLIDCLLGPDGTASAQARFAAPARLRDLAEKNHLNGLLIAERLGEVRQRRQFLDSLAGRADLYGPDGVTRAYAGATLSSRI